MISLDFLNAEHDRIMASCPAEPVLEVDPLMLAVMLIMKASGLQAGSAVASTPLEVPAYDQRREGWAAFLEVIASFTRELSGDPVQDRFARDSLRRLAISHVEALAILCIPGLEIPAFPQQIGGA